MVSLLTALLNSIFNLSAGHVVIEKPSTCLSHYLVICCCFFCFQFGDFFVVVFGNEKSGNKWTLHPHLQLFRFTGHGSFMWPGNGDGTGCFILSSTLKVASVVPNTFQWKQQMCTRREKGHLKQTGKQGHCIWNALVVLWMPYLCRRQHLKRLLESTQIMSANRDDFTIKSRLNSNVPLHFLYWAFKLLGFYLKR